MVMGVLKRRFCVYMVGGKGIYLFVLLTCGGCVCSILLLSLAARCWETMLVCMSCMFAFRYAVVTVQGSVGMFVVYQGFLKVRTKY